MCSREKENESDKKGVKKTKKMKNDIIEVGETDEE